MATVSASLTPHKSIERPIGYWKARQRFKRNQPPIKTLMVVDGSPDRNKLGEIWLDGATGKDDYYLLSANDYEGLDDGLYAECFDWHHCITSQEAQSAWAATTGEYIDREKRFASWMEEQVLTHFREVEEKIPESPPSPAMLALGTVAFSFNQEDSFCDDVPSLPMTIEQTFEEDRVSAIRFTAYVLLQAPQLLPQGYCNDDGSPLPRTIEGLQYIYSEMTDEQILTAMQKYHPFISATPD